MYLFIIVNVNTEQKKFRDNKDKSSGYYDFNVMPRFSFC